MRGWSHVSLWLSSPAVFVVVTRCISKCVQPATVWSTWPSEIWWECHTQRPRSRQSLRRWGWVFEQRNGAVLNGPDLVICRMKLLSSWQQVVTVLTIKSSCVVFRWRLWTVLMRVERCWLNKVKTFSSVWSPQNIFNLWVSAVDYSGHEEHKRLFNKSVSLFCSLTWWKQFEVMKT